MADGYQPTLAIVFLSVKQDREAISRLLEENGIQIFGATTAGEFIDGEIEEGSIAMLLLDMDPAYLNWNFLKQTMRPLSKKEPNWALKDKKPLPNLRL